GRKCNLFFHGTREMHPEAGRRSESTTLANPVCRKLSLQAQSPPALDHSRASHGIAEESGSWPDHLYIWPNPKATRLPPSSYLDWPHDPAAISPYLRSLPRM